MSTVQTVLGNITPNLLGRTLTHEHVALDFEYFYRPPPEDFRAQLTKKISMATLGFVRMYPYSSKENVRFYDEEALEAAKKDVLLYKQYGGGSIVENSSYGLKRNLGFIVELAQSTGVHFIAGTGHYIHAMQDAHHSQLTVEQLTDLYSKDIVTGIEVEGHGMVKCGFIGEVASVYPVHDFEKRAIRAAGEIQEVLGCGVSFHPDRSPEAPFEITRLYLEAGGRANKLVMSHLDRTIFDIDQLLEFAKLGCYLQYDLFGTECSYYQLNPTVDMISDGQRIDNLLKLIEEGLVDRLLMSHDIHTKHRLTSYGGHGYHHLYMNILPRMFARGATVEQVEQMTVTNPANWLAFDP
ncbi:phosphotriesterase-related protein [Scaptodrosophila lebanonensis]|uniref:Phosphotriesterase-related protein n=1 Tax=Drosophila lebanonensis TaxID=7225 RepID=A0A6J2TJM8_DROLE|nr:phosphotriesterase-related protein [Scaptodrosophila lebanonensis]